MSDDLYLHKTNEPLLIEREKTKQAELANQRAARTNRTVFLIAMFIIAGAIFLTLVLTGQDEDLIKWAGGGMLTVALLVAWFTS